MNLKRAPRGSRADWVDDAGITYDAVGGFDGRHLDMQWGRFTHQITRHLGKADLVPVDVSWFSAYQVLRIKEFIAPLGERVFLVGE